MLIAKPPLGALDSAIGSVRLRERHDLALVSVAIPLGGDAALAAALKENCGLDMPDARKASMAGGMMALKTGADQLMLIFPHESPDAERIIRTRLGGSGYTTDQTDNWARLEISGPGARAALERICPVDLHPNAFQTGAFARTVMEHMGSLILRTDKDTYLLMSASSSARSFLHAVETSAHYTS